MTRRKKTFVQNDNNFAIAYYRYSSASQNEASIDQQREMAQNYAESHGLTIVEEYIDKAESGLNDDRPDFNRMLSELRWRKPSVLILWKTDRLSRDRYTLAVSKKQIRDMGCAIKCVTEPFITENDSSSVIVESLLEAMAQQYSETLSENITRGMFYNARKALYIGYRIFGYKGEKDKPYEIDSNTAPIVYKIFNDYIAGKPLAEIARELNSQGIKSARGNDFTINSLRWILRNRAYIGEYRYADVVIPDGMPKIITEEMFEAAQAKASLNKRKHNANNDEPDAPRFWLTGKLFCGECGERVSGGSGTSKTKGRKYYYYSCNNFRKHKCCLKPVRKEMVENAVIRALDDILGDSENLASLAVDISAYYKRINSDDSFLKSLEKNLKDTETALKNLVKALEQGIFSETTQKRLTELETQKTNLLDAIASEKAKLAITEDDYSISKYYMFYKNADFKDEQTRDAVLEYFIDKIYLYNDKIVITCYYSDDKREVRLDELNEFIDSGGTDKGSSCSCYAPPTLLFGSHKSSKHGCFKLLLDLTKTDLRPNQNKCT